MSWKTQNSRRPELEALEVNAPEGYIGTRLYPTEKVAQKTGTIYYTPAGSKITAQHLLPYHSFRSRTAVANFVRDIPLSAKHPTYKTLSEIENALPSLSEKPMLIAWGGLDFCFDDTFFEGWKQRFPHAKTIYCPDAGHYLLEDAGTHLVPEIAKFLSE